jgi:hypothetical protein
MEIWTIVPTEASTYYFETPPETATINTQKLQAKRVRQW